MRHRLSTGGRTFAVLAAVIGATLAMPSASVAARAKATVAVADTATLSPDNQLVTVDVTASCARGWTVLEAFVTVSQPQADGMGGLPLSCTGRARTFTVEVRSLDAAFTPGPAQASAFVLIERRGRTQQAQDSQQIELLTP